MRTRTHLVLLIIASMLASAVGSLAAVATTAGTAHACSIAPPYAEVSPSVDLRPGQKVEIVGWGFNDIRMNEPPAQLVAPGDGDVDRPPPPCDFTLSPLSSLDVYWRGAPTTWLGTVSGPDFATTVVVPADALPGPATIAIGSFEAVVSVGNTIEIPPPCPLTMHPDGTISHVCPEPWPCPYASASGTQPAPDADYAPGSQIPCPEPCVDAAHTIDDGTVYDYRWDCPEPCSYIQVDPGAVQPDQAPWCPPPEPCPTYAPHSSEAQADQALWCPPPEPCPVYLDGGPGDAQSSLVSCPDPCQLVGGDAVWCPPVDPCGHYPTNATAEQPDLTVWCPPVDPCPVYLDGGPGDAQSSLVSCPDPCQIVGGDAVWCPPGPCRLVGGDAIVCPEVAAASSAQEPASQDVASASESQPVAVEPAAAEGAPVEPARVEPARVEPAAAEPVPVDPAPVEPVVAEPTSSAPAASEPAAPPISVEQAVAGQTASNLVAQMAQRMVMVASAIIASILG